MTVEKKNLKEEGNDRDVTAAMSTLHPHAAPGETKAGVVRDFLGLMNGMDTNGALKFFDQVMAQFGPGKSAMGIPDEVNKNRASIQAKPSAAMGKALYTEDLEKIFTGVELNEEQKGKISTLFEAAVGAAVEVVRAEIESENEEMLSEAIEQAREEINSSINEYLSYAVDEWMEENKLAVDSGIKLERAEKLFEGLKTLASQFGIEISDDENNVLDQVETEKEEFKSKLDDAVNENIELKKALDDMKKSDILRNVSAGLAATQVEKLEGLAKALAVESVEDFEKKVKVIKETYFPDNKQSKVLAESISGVPSEEGTKVLTEETEGTDKAPVVSPEMKKYLSVATRHA